MYIKIYTTYYLIMTKKIEFTDRAKKQIKKITSENDSKKILKNLIENKIKNLSFHSIDN